MSFFVRQSRTRIINSTYAIIVKFKFNFALNLLIYYLFSLLMIFQNVSGNTNHEAPTTPVAPFVRRQLSERY